MNKQELITRIKCLDEPYLKEEFILDLIEQLDEPQKPVVPQIVANYIEYTKVNEWDLLEAMDDVAYEDDKDLRKWCNNNMENFALAWINGYTIEKEKRYYVKAKKIADGCNYLNCRTSINEWSFAGISEPIDYRTRHTHKQLEQAGFGWVFDCPGIEIEEVE